MGQEEPQWGGWKRNHIEIELNLCLLMVPVREKFRLCSIHGHMPLQFLNPECMGKSLEAS